MTFRIVYRKSQYFVGRHIYMPQIRVLGLFWMDWCSDETSDGYETLEGAKATIAHDCDNTEKVVYP